MKKLLLTAVLALSTAAVSFAQTPIFTQNFEVTKTSMPAGWKQEVSNTNGGWQFNNAYGPNMGYYVATHTYCAFVDDWDNNSGFAANHDTLYTSSFNCSSFTSVFFSMDYMFWNDQGSEVGKIIISTDGGATWNTVANLVNGGGAWNNGTIWDISSFAAGQSNVMLAFTYFDGYPGGTYVAVGMCVDNINVYAPANYDLSVTSQNLPGVIQAGAPHTLSGTIYNYGGSTITSMNMNYTVNGGPVQTQTISGISGFNSLTSYNWSMGAKPFTPPAAGTYKVKIWADNLNGSNMDQIHSNDTLVAYFLAPDSVVTRAPLFEEYTGASCVFCMLAAPNVDTVDSKNVGSNSNVIRYHVPIPGRDFMYGETGYYASEPWVSPRMTYYGVAGAPDGYLDGTQLYPGADYNPPAQRYSSVTIASDKSVGSPIRITINSAKYYKLADSFAVSVSIKAFANFPSGLKAQAALTVDSVYYPLNQSSDDPDKSFAPPIGSSASGYSYTGAPDRYHPYLLKFDHVLEAMLPSASGTSLGSFTSGQTQTLTLGWKKSHPWGEYPLGNKASLGDTTKYDSASTYQFVIFVQDNSGNASGGIPAKYVYNSASSPVSIVLGMKEITNGVYFKLYPNPATNSTNIAFSLNKTQDVNIQVYNALGEKVYSMDQGKMSAGQHILPLNSAGLQSGVYIVKFNTDNASTVQKLIIQK